jgi:hypothetical protein
LALLLVVSTAVIVWLVLISAAAVDEIAVTVFDTVVVSSGDRSDGARGKVVIEFVEVEIRV